MAYIDYKKETAWKIVYTEFEGMTRRAVELLSAEVGEAVTRTEGIYSLHVLPLEKEGDSVNLKINTIIIGEYEKSPMIKSFIGEWEPDASYIIKVVKNPYYEGGAIVIITAREERYLYRAAAVFLDDYCEKYAPLHGGMRLRCELFKEELPEGVICRSVRTETRSIFAWGHAINDYRAYIRDMARLGLNQLILWNDYAPLNARDIVEYAHSFGIEVIWGYAWGWSDGHCEKMKNLDDATLEKLKKDVLRQYDEIWRGLGDGIYFQSFTEIKADNIGGRQIAAVVTDFVNDVASELYKRDPKLHLQFGLHAMSVKTHAEEIARVDKRIEILWEDIGAFPYAYVPAASGEEEFLSVLDFTENIIKHREGAPIGLVFKGFATLDWTRGKFVHQAGNYILGENTKALMENDCKLRSDAWRAFSAGWIRYGNYAKRMAEHILKLTNGRVNLCMAGLFDGGIWLPEAICTEIFEDPEESFNEILSRVAGRKSIKNN